MKPQDITTTRVNNDVNGNPRYVVHFLTFTTDKDLGDRYDLAIKRAKKLGGRKFNNKQYGGGIVFQSYNIDELRQSICDLVKNLK